LPEEWVGAATAAFGSDGEGLTHLEAGRTLREAIHSDPEGFLGRRHAEAYGGDPALLVKLLHAGERLPVHCPPDRDFARHPLGCPWGKTEAWVILGSDAPDPVVHLGFREDMGSGRLAELVEAQRVEALLTALNAVPVAAGDTVLVPAGMPHAIGRGVLLVELQEPTDFSVLLEWEGFAIDGRADGHLGLGFDVALACVDRAGWRPGPPRPLRRGGGAGPGARRGGAGASGGRAAVPGRGRPVLPGRAAATRPGRLPGGRLLDPGRHRGIGPAGDGRRLPGAGPRRHRAGPLRRRAGRGAGPARGGP